MTRREVVGVTAGGGVVRVAMWSGPRNISTAMMRSFGARPRTVVVDEPLYAHYLEQTGLDHPGRDEVLASQPTDWRAVAAQLTGPLPVGTDLQYQKHMSHHLLPSVGRDWLLGLRHAYLVRDPDDVVASYARVREAPTLDDLGYRQQVELHHRFGGPVVDARDVLVDPAGTLAALCAALDVPYDDHMLSWEPGPRDTDGVWAPYWYAAVEASTGFAPYEPTTHRLPRHLQAVADAARPLYEELHAVRVRHPRG